MAVEIIEKRQIDCKMMMLIERARRKVFGKSARKGLSGDLYMELAKASSRNQ